MIHKPCDKCGKMESVDFGVVLDDDFYCAECDLELNQKENNEKEEEHLEATEQGGRKIVIYGESSRLGESRLKQSNISFKQIPYDVGAL